MTVGVGGSTPERELERLVDMTTGVGGIAPPEFQRRIERARRLMEVEALDALYLNAGSNLAYFTGTSWHPSERMVGALLPRHGPLRYLAPVFERGTLVDRMGVDGDILGWHEHEDPYALLAGRLQQCGAHRLGVDESTPFFLLDGLRRAASGVELVSAAGVTQPCRMRKSPAAISCLICMEAGLVKAGLIFYGSSARGCGSEVEHV